MYYALGQTLERAYEGSSPGLQFLGDGGKDFSFSFFLIMHVLQTMYFV